MNALHTFLTGLAAGMDIIADCHGLSKRALIDAGCPDTTATRLLALADTYFGLTALLAIERYATRLRNKRQAWALRRELCGRRGMPRTSKSGGVNACARLKARRSAHPVSSSTAAPRAPGL